MLNNIPLVGAILAFMLGVMVVLNKNQNQKARLILGLIVLLNIHSLLEAYIFYQGLSWPGLGLSYLHYHLIGILFLIYTHFLLKIEINLKLWIGVAVFFTCIRFMLLAPIGEDILEVNSYTPEVILLSLDNLLSIMLNIGLLTLAFLKTKKLHFAVLLSASEQANYRWLKSLLVISIGLYLAILVINVSSLFVEDWLIYFKIESVINSIFSVALVYAGLRFPVFSMHGDFRDLNETSQKKYSKSSLNEEEADRIWKDIAKIMQEDKPYLNSEYRLNDLATSVGQSVHHVSQTINEKEGVSFSDFISRFRVIEAKALLNSGRAKQVTILAISLEAGFNSKTAFYNSFKKVTRKTPTAYLKELDVISKVS